jgi:hypothetical protein
MRRWMMAGGAGVLMMAGAGSAQAVEPNGAAAPENGAVEPVTRGGSIDPRSDVRSDPARMTGNPAVAPRVTGDDRSGRVTRDGLTRFRDARPEQRAHERNVQHPAPTFTDAG